MIAEALARLVGAIEHGRGHGKGRAADKKHSFWINGLEPARPLGREMVRQRQAEMAV